jgi:hypothetical protein
MAGVRERRERERRGEDEEKQKEIKGRAEGRAAFILQSTFYLHRAETQKDASGRVGGAPLGGGGVPE